MPLDTFLKMPEHRRQSIIHSGIAEFSKKSFADASTDAITKQCGISKGIIFHYFSSKKAFYLYCLEHAMKVITPQKSPLACDWYSNIFGLLESRMHICQQHPDEIRLSIMAYKETSGEVKDEKNQLLTRYHSKTWFETTKIITQSLEQISLKKSTDKKKAVAAFQIYTQTLINRYSERYQERPDAFFANAISLRLEFREYLDFMLAGLAE